MEDMEDMKASWEVTCTGASTKASTKSCMEVTFTKAYMEALMEIMEAFAEVMEYFTEATSTEPTLTEASVKAFTEASMGATQP